MKQALHGTEKGAGKERGMATREKEKDDTGNSQIIRKRTNLKGGGG